MLMMTERKIKAIFKTAIIAEGLKKGKGLNQYDSALFVQKIQSKLLLCLPALKTEVIY